MKWLAALCLAACVPSASDLRAPVDAELASRLGAPVEVGREDPRAIDALLARPVDAEAAVRIALLASPRMRVALDELGIAGADLATALAPGPAQVDVQLRHGGGANELEIDAIQPVLRLIAGGRARAAVRAELAATRAIATATALRLAARVEIAFDEVLAAQQEVALRHTANEAADAALRAHVPAAGGAADLALARDRDDREQTSIELARAEADLEARRDALNALLGLSGSRTSWTATGELPALPAAAPVLADLDEAAVAASLELAAGRSHVEAATDRLADERLHAILPDFGVGVSAIDRDHTWVWGPAMRFGLPVLDQRQGPRALAAAELARAGHELAGEALDLRERARAVRVVALAAYQEARRVHDVVLPLRQQIVDLTLHEPDAAGDPFRTIAARRALVEAGHEYVDALRRYDEAMAEVSALRRGVSLACTAACP